MACQPRRCSAARRVRKAGHQWPARLPAGCEPECTVEQGLRTKALGVSAELGLALNPTLACMQAAYHGVPIMALPGRVPDQGDSAAKAARLGFCLPVIIGKNFSATAVRDSLLRILHEPQFRRNAALVSRRMRARRCSPTQEAAGLPASSMHCAPMALSPSSGPHHQDAEEFDTQMLKDWCAQELWACAEAGCAPSLGGSTKPTLQIHTLPLNQTGVWAESWGERAP